jgi:hypothetical protein
VLFKNITITHFLFANNETTVITDQNNHVTPVANPDKLEDCCMIPKA